MIAWRSARRACPLKRAGWQYLDQALKAAKLKFASVLKIRKQKEKAKRDKNLLQDMQKELQAKINARREESEAGLAEEELKQLQRGKIKRNFRTPKEEPVSA
eukprot:scaffold1298_cov382-Prasinococcus_capsulatus_cf.AAC.15